MAGLNKNVLSINIMVLLLIFLQAAPVKAKDPQTFNTDTETGFYYTIQKGDALWDLSEKFYNSQWDWPGLWELNKDIKNPHWIYPGNKIRIYLKYGLKKQAPEQMGGKTPRLSEPVTPQFNYPIIDRAGFIKKIQEPELGTIIREEDGNLMMSADDIIYITPSSDGILVPGERYHVFSPEPVKQKIKGTVFQGTKHLIKSEIRVLETHAGYARAVIEKAYREATVGDKIMAFKHRNTTLTIQETPDPIDGVLVCSENNDVMINDNQIGFINKGTDDNIQSGQIYTIYQIQEKRSRHDGEGVKMLPPLDSGRLIVLHTEAISSTVLVLSSKRDIHPGDLVN